MKKTDYLNLPIGSISRERIAPWLTWVGLQDFGNFDSFSEVVDFFKEIAKDRLEGREAVDFNDSSYNDGMENVLEENILFFFTLRLYKLEDQHIVTFVKFFIDGTANVESVYCDDAFTSNYLHENLKMIAQAIEKEGERLSWQEAIFLIEKIKSGNFNKIIELPKF